MKRLPRGELEARVMDVLWERDDWVTPAEVHDELRRRRRLTYTTVTTILVRLVDKAMIERRRDGRAFRYRPLATRDEWAARRMHEILETSGDRRAALGHFVDEITRREVEELRRLLKRRPR